MTLSEFRAFLEERANPGGTQGPSCFSLDYIESLFYLQEALRSGYTLDQWERIYGGFDRLADQSVSDETLLRTLDLVEEFAYVNIEQKSTHAQL